MNVMIVGGGKRVYFLCRTFLSKGHTVTVVSRDHEDCVTLARRLKVTVVEGDGSAPAVLEEAGARRAHALVAVTPHDQDNLVICQLASGSFGVPRTVAIVNDPDNEEVFRNLGLTAFSITPTIASLIEQETALDEVTSLVPVARGKVNITEIGLKPESPVVGKSLGEIQLPQDALITVVIRNNEPIIPRGATILRAGDRVILVSLPGNFGPALRIITGEKE